MGTCLSCHFDANDDGFVTFKDTDGSIKVLIIALNYEYIPDAVLTCRKDAEMMFRIATRTGVEDITVITDKAGLGAANFPTRSYLLDNLQKAAATCEEGDWFVWFFAGHGVNVPDRSGDERRRKGADTGSAEGFDQAFVTPNKKGQLVQQALLIDDDFARALDNYVPEGVRILCICDCCHSGTICDIDSYKYRHEIYQISAADDMQEAEDSGSGGLLTNALRRAVRKHTFRSGNGEFSIQEVFDAVQKDAEGRTNEQDVQLQWSGTHPSKMAWPLSYHWSQYVTKPQYKVDIHEFEEDVSEPESN